MPGSIRSSTIRSGGFARASFSASSPLVAPATLYPPLVRLYVTSSRMSFSSSTTRMDSLVMVSSFEAKPAS